MYTFYFFASFQNQKIYILFFSKFYDLFDTAAPHELEPLFRDEPDVKWVQI